MFTLKIVTLIVTGWRIIVYVHFILFSSLQHTFHRYIKEEFLLFINVNFKQFQGQLIWYDSKLLNILFTYFGTHPVFRFHGFIFHLIYLFPLGQFLNVRSVHSYDPFEFYNKILNVARFLCLFWKQNMRFPLIRVFLLF